MTREPISIFKGSLVEVYVTGSPTTAAASFFTYNTETHTHPHKEIGRGGPASSILEHKQRWRKGLKHTNPSSDLYTPRRQVFLDHSRIRRRQMVPILM